MTKRSDDGSALLRALFDKGLEGALGGSSKASRAHSDDSEDELAIDKELELKKHHQKLDKFTLKQFMFVATNIKGCGIDKNALQALGWKTHAVS
eukprot:2109947-Pyramimonas_sp.AAC.1